MNDKGKGRYFFKDVEALDRRNYGATYIDTQPVDTIAWWRPTVSVAVEKLWLKPMTQSWGKRLFLSFQAQE